MTKLTKMKFPQTDIKIGRRLRDFRKAAGMSQEEIGRAIGVSFQQIQKFENGKNRIAASSLIVLCQEFGISPNDVLGNLLGDADASADTNVALAGKVSALESRLSEIKRLAA